MKLAILGSALPAQTSAAHRPERDPIEVVASAETLPAFEEAIEKARPEALLVELEALGDDAIAALRRLESVSGAELTLVVYYFTQKEQLRALSDIGVKLVRGPVQMDGLRHHFMRFIVRDLLATSACTCAGRLERGALVVETALEAVHRCPHHGGQGQGPHLAPALEQASTSLRAAHRQLRGAGAAEELSHG